MEIPTTTPRLDVHPSPPPPLPGWRETFRVWLRIGLLGFGGPAGQIALMHRELVEQRRWIGEARFLNALNYCMLLPGPEAQQLAVYIGWLLRRTLGGVLAGLLFVLPGALVLALLSFVYVRWGELGWVAAMFLGLKAAVIALVAEALLRIGRRALKTALQRWLAAAAFLAIFAFAVPFPLIVLGAALCGLALARWVPAALPAEGVAAAAAARGYLVDERIEAGLCAHTQPSPWRALAHALGWGALWLAPVFAVSAWLGSGHVLAQQGWFFSQAAVVTFGGAYAVLAYVAQRAVEDFGWLRPGEMAAGLALAETTPGPLILVLQFVGFVAAFRLPGGLDPWHAAALGAALTTWVTFAPSFLFIFVGAPYVEALRGSRALRGALACIGAAVVGVVLNLALWLALHTLFAASAPFAWGPLRLELPAAQSWQPVATLLTALALLAQFRFHLGLGWLLAGSAALGVLAQLLR